MQRVCRANKKPRRGVSMRHPDLYPAANWMFSMRKSRGSGHQAEMNTQHLSVARIGWDCRFFFFFFLLSWSKLTLKPQYGQMASRELQELPWAKCLTTKHLPHRAVSWIRPFSSLTDTGPSPSAQSADQPRRFSTAGHDEGKAVICMTLNTHNLTRKEREAR